MCRMPACPSCLGVVEMQVRCSIDEALINAVNMHILRRRIAEDDRINLGADPLVESHSGNSDFIVNLCVVLPFVVFYRPFCFEEPGPSRHANRFQCRGNRKTDRLIRP